MHAVTAMPPPQVPLKHVVLVRHALPELQGAPLFPGALTHAMETSLHWFTSQGFAGAGHAMGVPAHVPFKHWSLVVQYLPSLHAPELFVGDFTQPIVGSHLPTLQVSSRAEQLTAVPPVHAPARHVPPIVHSAVHDCPSLAC
jgi:hypothetical protein